ncbi:MAG TPA: hypothetical protein PLV58_05500 [Campylobacterales bacterium]|nr:hypothetical protein [Campylobacterales bacterium]
MDSGVIGLMGVGIGAVITYLSNSKLENKKHNLAMQKHIFDVKRLKLEEMLILVNDANNSARKRMGEFIMLCTYKQPIKYDSSDSLIDSFAQLKNYINMYFHDEQDLFFLVSEADEAYKSVQEVNGMVIEYSQKNAVKEEMQQLNAQILKRYENLSNRLQAINNKIPEMYKDMESLTVSKRK